MASVEGTDGGASEAQPFIEDRLESLNLVGEEEEDLDLSEELDELIKEVRWLGLFRVHTTKPFSHAALFSALRFAWSAAKDVTFKVLEPNLFLVQFHCLGDWNQMMEGGPWLFRGAPIVLAEYDGFSSVKDCKLEKIPVWVRIQGVPDGLMKRKDLAEKVAQKVGEPPIVVAVTDGKINLATYLRARVFVDIQKPLVRVVPITLREKRKFLVQYEKLPIFCHFCGVVGHDVTECGDGLHKKEDCQWGEWLLVNFAQNSKSRGEGRDGRTRGGMQWRGRGRGRG